MGRREDELRAGHSPEEAIQVLHPVDDSQSGTCASDASGDALLAEAEGDRLGRLDEDAEKSAGRGLDVLARAEVRWLKPSVAVVADELAPCTRGAAPSGAQSCAAEASADELEALEPQAWQLPEESSRKAVSMSRMEQRAQRPLEALPRLQEVLPLAQPAAEQPAQLEASQLLAA